MSENNALLFGVLREIGRDILDGVVEAITPTLEDISARLAKLEGAGITKSGDDETVALLQSIERNLIALGRLGGEIHGRVAPSSALPRDLLSQPVMAEFCDHYPSHVAPAIDADKLAANVADARVLPPDEVKSRRDALADSLPDTAFYRYQLRVLDAAIAAEQIRQHDTRSR